MYGLCFPITIPLLIIGYLLTLVVTLFELYKCSDIIRNNVITPATKTMHINRLGWHRLLIIHKPYSSIHINKITRATETTTMQIA